MSTLVGIDDLNLYASSLAINLSTIANARHTKNTVLQNVGFERRSVIPSFEDPVTLAVNAAKPIVEAVGVDNFELLIVATETGVDYGKPLSSYIHKYLGLGQRCRNFEIKHACYAGTAALQMAASWVRSDVAPRKKALVIMTDIARTHLSDLVELSTGAGAVALSVAVSPQVFELEESAGYASFEVFDVARPTPTFELINSSLSIGAYLDLLEMAWEEYRHIVGPISCVDHFAYTIFHTPFVALVEQAHRLLLIASDGVGFSKDSTVALFEQMVTPSLGYIREIGNIYSGSLYVALIGLLESISAPAAGTRIGCFSYGSGSCAEFFSGLIGPKAQQILAEKNIGERLATRRIIDFTEYEALALAIERSLTAQNFIPDLEMPSGHYYEVYEGLSYLVLDKVENYHRRYRWS